MVVGLASVLQGNADRLAVSMTLPPPTLTMQSACSARAMGNGLVHRVQVCVLGDAVEYPTQKSTSAS